VPIGGVSPAPIGHVQQWLATITKEKNMKRQILYAFAVALVITGVVQVPSVLAQSSQLRAEIPFEFYAGDKLMPAGTYATSTLPGGQVIQLYNLSNNASTFVSTSQIDNRHPGVNRLVFNRYGDTKFLTQIHWGDTNGGREVHPMKLELEAQNKQTPTRVAIVPR
jgi:hypothetical protein